MSGGKGNDSPWRRQMLMEELDRRDAELYDAREAFKELNENLLAGNQATAGGCCSVVASLHPSASASSSSSSTSSPTITSSATSTRFWYQLPHLPTTHLSPRRMPIILAIFLLAIFIPHIQSLAQGAAGNSWQAIRGRRFVAGNQSRITI